MLKPKDNIIKFFVWFENNIDVVYRYAIRLALGIWFLLFLMVISLLVVFLNTCNILPLSAAAIALSAMIASLMAWYNIETTQRAVKKQEEQTINRDFLLFYSHSFRFTRMLFESLKYEKNILPDEIPQMVLSSLEQYLDNYSQFVHFHSLLNANEKRRLAEAVWGLHHDFAKLKRSISLNQGQIIRETIESTHKSLKSILNDILKRSFDENDFSEYFDNQLYERGI